MGGEAHSGPSPWGYKKPRWDADSQSRSWRVGHSAVSRAVGGELESSLEPIKLGSSLDGSPAQPREPAKSAVRWKVRQRNQGSQSELGGPGKLTLKRLSERPVHSSSASSARPDRPGRSKGRTAEGNRASRSPSRSSDWRVYTTGTEQRHQRPPAQRPSSRHQGGQVTGPVSQGLVRSSRP